MSRWNVRSGFLLERVVFQREPVPLKTIPGMVELLLDGKALPKNIKSYTPED